MLFLFKFFENRKFLSHQFFYSKLRATWGRLEEIQKWISEEETRIIITQHTGIELTNVIFTDPKYGLPSTYRTNAETLVLLFNLCTCCYTSICKLLGLEVDPRCKPMKSENIELF